MVAQGVRDTPVTPARSGRPRVRLSWIVLSVAALALVVYASVCAYMALTLTRPDRKPFTHLPAQFGLASQDVEFTSRVDGIPLRGWLLPGAGDPSRHRPVIMVHGKGTDRQAGPGEGILAIAAPLVRAGYTVLTFDLRGSGESGGERFTLGAQEVRDVEGAVDYLRQRGLADDGVSLVGFSMGAATALLTALDEPAVRAVAEDSGYADLGDLIEAEVPKASGLPPFFTPGMALAIRGLIGVDLYAIRPVDGMPRLAATNVPVLIVHGEADTYVPPLNALRLAASYGPRAETLIVPGAGHVEGHEKSPAEYDARLRAFLDRS